MKVQNWPLDKIIPYSRNPRKNEGVAISKVAASIKEFGWQQVIVVDKEGVVVVGDTRLKAAYQLGLKEAPVKVANELSDAQIKAYRIADNRVAEESSWDDALLSLELADLEEANFDLLMTGLDIPEIEKLTIGDGATDAGTGDGDEDETQASDDFKGFDEEIETEHQCPKCSYKWSGKSTA